MKKIFLKVRSIVAVVIMAAIATTAFAGCGESANEKQESSASTSSTVVVEEKSEESTIESSSEDSEEESKVESSIEEESAVESSVESSVADESQDEPSQESSVEESSEEPSGEESAEVSEEENLEPVYIVTDAIHLDDSEELTRIGRTKRPIYYAYTDDSETFYEMDGIVFMVSYDSTCAIVGAYGYRTVISIDSSLITDLGPID